jgi:hypothetical protein
VWGGFHDVLKSVTKLTQLSFANATRFSPTAENLIRFLMKQMNHALGGREVSHTYSSSSPLCTASLCKALHPLPQREGGWGSSSGRLQRGRHTSSVELGRAYGGLSIKLRRGIKLQTSHTGTLALLKHRSVVRIGKREQSVRTASVRVAWWDSEQREDEKAEFEAAEVSSSDDKTTGSQNFTESDTPSKLSTIVRYHPTSN